MHVAQRFERFLETYRRPDGQRWGGAELEKATGGIVTRSYVTNLRKGRIENPGYEKMRAIAKAMGFAPEVWFEDALAEGRSIGEAEDSRGVAGRLEHLFEVVRNPKTGEPYTNAEVARMTLGDLPEENVERIRSGVYSVRALQPEGHMIGEWPRFSTGMWRKLDTIGVEKIASQLAAISRAEGGKSLALLCHEDVTPARGHRCHRVVVSLWWMEQTGREIPELTNEGELLSLHQLHRQTAPILPKEAP